MPHDSNVLPTNGFGLHHILLKLFISSLVFCANGHPVSAKLVAERITEENFEAFHVGGPDADAGIDDWFLSNGTLCAAISDAHHESALAPEGGVLIDVGHCGADNDQWAALQPLLNLSQEEIVTSQRSPPADPRQR